METYISTIRINQNDVLNYVYSQSAWYCLHDKNREVITPDKERSLYMRLEEAFSNFTQRFAGYLTNSLINTSNTYKNIELSFKFSHSKTPVFEEALRLNIIFSFAHFILMKMYGELDPDKSQSIFKIEWERYNAKIMLAFSHDSL